MCSAELRDESSELLLLVSAAVAGSDLGAGPWGADVGDMKPGVPSEPKDVEDVVLREGSSDTSANRDDSAAGATGRLWASAARFSFEPARDCA